jgi:hypothetical protein
MTNRSGRLGAGDSLTPLGQILPFVRPGTAVGRPGPAVASASGPAPSPPASRPVLAQAPPWTPLSAPGYRLGRGGPERLLACEGCGVQDWYPRNVTPRCGGCLAELAAQRQAEAEARQLAAGGLGSIPTRYRGLQFGSPDLAARVAVPRAISVAQQLAPLEQFPVVLITGGAGRGKTSLGTAILRWHIDRGEAPGATEEEQVSGRAPRPSRRAGGTRRRGCSSGRTPPRCCCSTTWGRSPRRSSRT